MSTHTMQTYPFISNRVKISGTNRSAKVTEHFTCISVDVINCTTCTLCKTIYIPVGETARTLAHRIREHLRDVQETTQMRPNQFLAILIFLITPITTWLFSGYPYTTEIQKAAKSSNKNSSFNRGRRKQGVLYLQ